MSHAWTLTTWTAQTVMDICVFVLLVYLTLTKANKR